ncbi:hypothetical protein [Streptomyces tsukubensis]|uniref:hypothetical protein n=1 Tax=Streptomyces tsukubensis TaxID=83656 RepID=UPI0015C2CBB1|nr:hypothetical protein [Streptomyces tsukubensis]
MPQADAGITGRIRATEKRVRRLSPQFGPAHEETRAARSELAEMQAPIRTEEHHLML